MAKIPISTHVKLVNGLDNSQRKELIKDAANGFTREKTPTYVKLVNGIEDFQREKMIEDAANAFTKGKVPDSYKRFAKAEAEAARKEKILNANPNLRKKFEKKKNLNSDNTSTTELQSGPISANDFAAMSGSDNRASSHMGKRLFNRLNGTKAKIKAIEDNADLSEIDKTKQINDIYSTFGDNVKNIDDVSRILQQEAQNGPGIRDYVHAYSGHVVGAGMVLGMGNAVLDAADTKGQKTNAQLYSNPF